VRAQVLPKLSFATLSAPPPAIPASDATVAASTMMTRTALLVMLPAF
jgi:hypothetical protein